MGYHQRHAVVEGASVTSDTSRLVPGFLTNIELDQALGSSRTRQRWEAQGLLPRGHWIKGFQKRIGIYPEIVLARVVAGVDARESEAAVAEAMRIGAHLIDSTLFAEIGRSLEEYLSEYRGLSRQVLDRLGERGLIAPLQVELASVTESLGAMGIDFRCHSATLTFRDESLRLVDLVGAEMLLPATQLLGIVEVGDTVVVEDVQVGARTLSYVLPTAPTTLADAQEDMWEEMFGGVTATPIAIPRLAADTGSEPGGGDVVRQRRRIRIDIPAELYGGANTMASRSRSVA